MFTFAPATKPQARARIALAGTPGAGMTRTALILATALGGKIGVVDTERGRSRKWADQYQFEHITLHDFDPDNLVRATIAGQQQHIDTLIVDTVSPFWNGIGGHTEQVDRAGGGNTGWAKMRPTEYRMLDALFGYPGNIIVLLRPTLQYVVDSDDQGHPVGRPIALESQQRKGFERDFDLVGDMHAQTLRVTKSTCPDLTGRRFVNPTGQIATDLYEWLNTGATGEILNPVEIGEWAWNSATPDEIDAKLAELEHTGQTCSIVPSPVADSEFIAIGDLLERRATALRKAAAAKATLVAVAG